MNVLTALAIGYLIGAKSGGKDLERLGRSLKDLYETDEFADVVLAARAQLGSTLRGLADVLDASGVQGHADGDLVATVRHLVRHQ